MILAVDTRHEQTRPSLYLTIATRGIHANPTTLQSTITHYDST
jgi:hypothetical protein